MTLNLVPFTEWNHHSIEWMLHIAMGNILARIFWVNNSITIVIHYNGTMMHSSLISERIRRRRTRRNTKYMQSIHSCFSNSSATSIQPFSFARSKAEFLSIFHSSGVAPLSINNLTTSYSPLCAAP